MRFSARTRIFFTVLILFFSAFWGCKKDEEVPAQAPASQPPRAAKPAAKPVEPKDVFLEGMYRDDFKSRLEGLTIMATKAEVELTGFQLQDEAARTRGNKQYLGMTAEGSLIDISRYLNMVSRGDIVFRAHKIELRDIVKSRDSRKCKAEIILATYRSLTIPQDGIETENDAAEFLEGERARTNYVARAIYEVDELSEKKNFDLKSLDYKCPDGEFSGVINDRNNVKELKIWLEDEYCFESVEVKGIKNYGSKSRKGATGPALFTMSFKISDI